MTNPMSRGGRSTIIRPTRETSARMRVVRQRDTKPELAVRSVLHRLGARYRVCPRNLPGSPDIANMTRRWCIFVHGCFWHGHEDCPLATVPKTNTEWWKRKVADNRARDRRKEDAVRALGFRVEVVWQCETRDETALEGRLALFLATERKSADRAAHRRR
ncbi:MAG: very short patch repair endonuclease [bacterium]